MSHQPFFVILDQDIMKSTALVALVLCFASLGKENTFYLNCTVGANADIMASNTKLKKIKDARP